MPYLVGIRQERAGRLAFSRARASRGLRRPSLDVCDWITANSTLGKGRIGHRTLNLRKRYGDVAGDEAGRLRTRKTPTTRTMITVTLRPTSMRY